MNIQKGKTVYWEGLSIADNKEIEKGIEALNNGKRVAFIDLIKKIS